MGRDLAENYPRVRSLFDRADDVLGFELSRVMIEGPMEELTRTSRCQPALYVHGLAILEVLRERMPSLELAACAGLSLGEFTAHAAAGTFDFETGLKLVFQRGTFMEEACEETKGAMAAMIGGDEAAVRALAAECGVEVANFNCPGQIVISGGIEGIEAAVALAKERGIKKAIKLRVAGAYHSRLMQSAQDKLASVLAATELHAPRVPVVCNYSAAPVTDPGEIRRMLEKQVTGSVRWEASMRHLLARGHGQFLELGPDSALKNFMTRIDPGSKVLSIGDEAGLDAALAELIPQASPALP
jgi:[acyl-carrier-protein] S-malonyltransferase